MKLLISPSDKVEALQAFEGGADIIDIKNPKEGSLGANFPWVIRDIQDALPDTTKISATIGDLDFKPGFAALAAAGLSTLNLDYIKAGLFVESIEKAMILAKSIFKAAEMSQCKIILASYADYQNFDLISPKDIISIAHESGADGVMIDTFEKKGKSLFQHMQADELKEFVDTSKEHGIICALAGSVSIEHIKKIKDLNPDIVGVRGAVCTYNNRLNGKVEKEKVAEFKKMLNGRVV